MPKNWGVQGLGVGLCAADALGRRLGSADADGLGGAGTDMCPPRWSDQHDHCSALA
jgi:hypothetical protein